MRAMDISTCLALNLEAAATETPIALAFSPAENELRQAWPEQRVTCHCLLRIPCWLLANMKMILKATMKCMGRRRTNLYLLLW